MKNIKRYTNISDAYKAYEEHKKRCKCDCSFEDWLDMDEEKTVEDAREIKEAMAGMMATLVVGHALGFNKEVVTKEEISGVECPICHGKNGYINGTFAASFKCKDCKAFIGFAEKGVTEISEFKKYIDDLCKKNIKV